MGNPEKIAGIDRDGIFYFVTFLFIVKILFAILAIIHIYLKRTGKGDEYVKLNHFVEFWKERCEFIFIIGVSLLLLYFFFPGRGWRRDSEIKTTFEMRFLFFVYGIIILVNLDWKLFIGESPLLDIVQKIL
jgi:hypothetical protein